MGFNKDVIIEALKSTRSLEQATDYLLNHNMSVQQSIEQDLMEASTSSTSREVLNPPKSEMDVDDENKVTKFSIDFKPNIIQPQEIIQFCEEALERTYEFIEYIPEAVNSGTNLISVLYRNCNPMDKLKFVLNIVKPVVEKIEMISAAFLDALDKKKFKEIDELIYGNTGIKFQLRLKTLILLLDENNNEIRNEVLNISSDSLIKSLMDLLFNTEKINNELNLKKSPCWLPNLIEVIDAVDNVCSILQRKSNMKSVCSDTWRWYDISTGKWNTYSELNNTMIKNAYNCGEKAVAINIGRQRYTINFQCMTQVSEASGSHRPVLPSLKILDAISKKSSTEYILTRTLRSRTDRSGIEKLEEVIPISVLNNFDAVDETSNDSSNQFTTVDEKKNKGKCNFITESSEQKLLMYKIINVQNYCCTKLLLYKIESTYLSACPLD